MTYRVLFAGSRRRPSPPRRAAVPLRTVVQEKDETAHTNTSLTSSIILTKDEVEKLKNETLIKGSITNNERFDRNDRKPRNSKLDPGANFYYKITNCIAGMIHNVYMYIHLLFSALKHLKLIVYDIKAYLFTSIITIRRQSTGFTLWECNILSQPYKWKRTMRVFRTRSIYILSPKQTCVRFCSWTMVFASTQRWGTAISPGPRAKPMASTRSPSAGTPPNRLMNSPVVSLGESS